mgnify:CR=1 FL=1
MQLWNTSLPIVVRVEGKITLLRFEQLLKVLFSMLTPSGISISCSPVQPENAPFRTRIEFGSLMVCSEEQLANADASIVVSPSGRLTLESEVQPSKQYVGRMVSLVGRVISANDEQYWKT